MRTKRKVKIRKTAGNERISKTKSKVSKSKDFKTVQEYPVI